MSRFAHTAATLSLAFAVLAPSPAQAADNCTPSRALLVLDKSSSMQTGTIGGVTKWNIAVEALSTVVTSYESSIELGLMLFPNPNECSPGSVLVEPGLAKGSAIMSALGDVPPEQGNWTPMSQTLDAAGQETSMLDGDRPRYVVLITDGWQWCYPYDASTRFDPVDSVAALRAKGIVTYVVGFGDGVDSLALNRMAVEGGTALPGCDPTGDNPMAESPCFYRAENPTSLVTALDSIALDISAEICDGEDNDCNGVVDEGCDCIPGASRSCGLSRGACMPGVQTCDGNGFWGMCDGSVSPTTEVCDGVDNDCDGETDEGGDALCPAGQSCTATGCVETDPVPPAGGGDEPAGDSAGCGCRTGGTPSAPAGAASLLGLLGLGLALIRRRRV